MVKQRKGTTQVICRECEHLDRDREYWQYKMGQCAVTKALKWPEMPRCCMKFEEWKKED